MRAAMREKNVRKIRVREKNVWLKRLEDGRRFHSIHMHSFLCFS